MPLERGRRARALSWIGAGAGRLAARLGRLAWAGLRKAAGKVPLWLWLIAAGVAVSPLLLFGGILAAVLVFGFEAVEQALAALWDLFWVLGAVPSVLAAGVWLYIMNQSVRQTRQKLAFDKAQSVEARFAGAAGQLADARAAVRLAGLQALGRLAGDAPEQAGRGRGASGKFHPARGG